MYVDYFHTCDYVTINSTFLEEVNLNMKILISKTWSQLLVYEVQVFPVSLAGAGCLVLHSLCSSWSHSCSQLRGITTVYLILAGHLVLWEVLYLSPLNPLSEWINFPIFTLESEALNG